MRVDARDVLDPNAKTLRGFHGKVVGYFRRCGPNSWDDYVYRAEDGDEVDVYPQLRVQLEERGPEFRMRRDGKVVRVRWIPSKDERKELRRANEKKLREALIEGYLDTYQNKAGKGAVAVIANKLRGL
jgi:hypothetical protein